MGTFHVIIRQGQGIINTSSHLENNSFSLIKISITFCDIFGQYVKNRSLSGKDLWSEINKEVRKHTNLCPHVLLPCFGSSVSLREAESWRGIRLLPSL